MKWFAILVVALGCQAGADSNAKPSAGGAAPAAGPRATTAEYAGDIQRLCDVMELSGANDLPPGDRMLPMANWLAANIKTPEGKAFMIQTNSLVGNEHADALEAEAKRAGLPGCALAAMWRQP